MYKLICLFALVAFAAATYSSDQYDEVVNDIIHEAIPTISVDTNCLKNAGIQGATCLVGAVVRCSLSNFPPHKNLPGVAACLADKCGGKASAIVGCIRV